MKKIIDIELHTDEDGWHLTVTTDEEEEEYLIDSDALDELVHKYHLLDSDW